jgi:hypothetical protein
MARIGIFDSDSAYGGYAELLELGWFDSSLEGGVVALPAGVSAASAENNPLGVPAGVPAGQTAASAEHNPSATGTGTASPAGDAAASAENNPIGTPYALPAGQTAASSENNPIGAAIALPAGVTAASAENNPIGVAIALPAGLSLVAGEHDAEGDDVAFPAGVNATAAVGTVTAAGETAETIILNVGGGLTGRVQPQFRRAAAPATTRKPQAAKPAQPATISISATARPQGVSAAADWWPPAAHGSALAVVTPTLTLVTRGGEASGSGSAVATVVGVDRELEAFAAWLAMEAA